MGAQSWGCFLPITSFGEKGQQSPARCQQDARGCTRNPYGIHPYGVPTTTTTHLPTPLPLHPNLLGPSIPTQLALPLADTPGTLQAEPHSPAVPLRPTPTRCQRDRGSPCSPCPLPSGSGPPGLSPQPRTHRLQQEQQQRYEPGHGAPGPPRIPRAALPLPPAASAAPEKGCKSLLLLLSAPGASRRAAEPAPSSVGTQSPDPSPAPTSPPRNAFGCIWSQSSRPLHPSMIRVHLSPHTLPCCLSARPSLTNPRPSISAHFAPALHQHRPHDGFANEFVN